MDGGAQHVLVVDDDASIRFLCRVNLELEGWTVREAANLTDAREQLTDGLVSVLLLDVHIGGENGVAFLNEIRRDRPDLPVAMLTGSIGTPTLEGVMPNAVIPKPFTLEVLVDTVRELAQGSAAAG